MLITKELDLPVISSIPMAIPPVGTYFLVSRKGRLMQVAVQEEFGFQVLQPDHITISNSGPKTRLKNRYK
jgi:hypothetical protein